MDEFAKKYGDSFFAFGVGFFLFSTTEIPSWGMWATSILVVIFALVTLIQFGNQARFWQMVQQYPEQFGPEGASHQGGLLMFDGAVNLVREYESPQVFWISLAASVYMMGGLLQHEWHIPLAFEFGASVLGYAFIKSFLKNYHVYYGLINGSENTDAKI